MELLDDTCSGSSLNQTILDGNGLLLQQCVRVGLVLVHYCFFFFFLGSGNGHDE